MPETLTLTYERVDDIPLLLAHLERMGVQQLLDKHFPTHGNWQGLSLGWVASIWLGHILSQGDHRLSYVQPWADQRLETLRIGTGQSVRALDLSDDRLEAVLRYLSEDEPWREFEEELGGQLVRVYDLRAERVRLDPTTASGYWGVTEDGLFQWGHSKNRRPDLAQVKIMLATLDPLSLPVATEVRQEAAEGILRRYRVQGLLQLDYQVTTQERHLRGYRERPAQVVVSSSVELSVTLDEAALVHQIRMLGWRVYVSNQPQAELSLSQAVVAYREEYLIERGFGRLKGQPLSMGPMYLQKDDHVTGLIRLLSIGLRMLTLLEFQMRRGLASQQEKLSGLYPGNPKRATARPTAEQLLAAFREITLLLIDTPHETYVHLSSLSPLQQQILALLNFDLEIYTQLGPEMVKPP